MCECTGRLMNAIAMGTRLKYTRMGTEMNEPEAARVNDLSQIAEIGMQ